MVDRTRLMRKLRSRRKQLRLMNLLWTCLKNMQPLLLHEVLTSGGQKQRIAIARAILLKPSILILDDSTSSVDVETEVKIQDALKNLMKNTTVFMVAQRISTVLTADKIVVIEKGKIAAEGNHKELMRSSKIYKEIFDSQLGEGDNFKSVGISRQVIPGEK